MQTTQKSLTLASLLLALGTSAFAEGTETLNAPTGIQLQQGTDYILAGAGLADTGVGTASLFVPDGASVVQVLAYWDGLALENDLPGSTDTIELNGIEVTGTLIGGPSAFIGQFNSFSYRADVTALGLITAGENNVTAEGLDFGFRNNGFGLIVITDDGQATETVGLVDGSDFAFGDFAAPYDTTDLQTFTFEASDEVRLAQLGMFVTGVDLNRPSVIEVTIGDNVTRLADLLGSNSGAQFDVQEFTFDIDPGITSLSVRVLSEDSGVGPLAGGDIASLNWIAAGLSIQSAETPVQYGCSPHEWICNWWRWDPWCTSDNVTSSLVLTDRFNATLGVTPWQSGLSNRKKLWHAIHGCGWGGWVRRALNRHTVAALLNADANINYPYTVDEIRTLYQDAVGAIDGPETPWSLLCTLYAANHLGCPCW